MSLIVDNLSLSFGSKNVFQNISFELNQGDIACLLGHSGCGKTSILRCISGFETPQSGSITFNQNLLFQHHAPSIHLAPHQRKIGMVFQDYALFVHLTVAQNIAFGLWYLDKHTQEKRVDELLDLIDMKEYKKHYPHELSGGQQQRVALARTLAPKPKLVLLDEPFSNLDVDLRASLSKDVRHLLKQENVSAILVTHDQSEAFAVADFVGIMAQGIIEQWDTPTNLYQQPKTSHVAQFIGDGTLLDVQHASDGIATTQIGNIPYHTITQEPTLSKAKILIRPHDIHLTTSGQTEPATIIHKEFKGGYWLYTLAFGDIEILAQTPISQDHKLRQQVWVSIQQGWLINEND